MFYTTPTDDGAIAVSCDRCYGVVSCPDPWAAAAEITHHHCDPGAAMAGLGGRGPSLDGEPSAALHQLASAQSQARCERQAARTRCPVCHQDG